MAELKDTYLEALLATGFEERYIHLKGNESLTAKIFEVLQAKAMQVLIKNKDKTPNITPECKEVLKIAEKYYVNGSLSVEHQMGLVKEITNFILRNFKGSKDVLNELKSHQEKLVKSIMSTHKEILTLDRGFFPILTLTDSFDSEIIFEYRDSIYWIRTKELKLQDEPMIQEAVEFLIMNEDELRGIVGNRLEAIENDHEIEAYKNMLS